ncbi:phage tail tape measure protein [Paenibacillus dendritiformis]|uniref:phage tail tape measure protein n=1 Tax=Paenibacillus dendritiformis TaxID=130049 RepID=UPI0036472F5D
MGVKDISKTMTLKDGVSGTLNKISAGTVRYRKELVDLKEQGTRTWEGLKSGIAGAASVILPALSLGAGIKAAVGFQDEMANVATLLDGDVKSKLKGMSGQVLQLSKDTGMTTSLLTDGLYQVVSALGDSSDSMEILEIAAKGASAGNATVTDSVNLLSAVTKGYGDTSAAAAAKASDLAFETAKLGQTDFPSLAASMGKVIPLAVTMKIKQEELFGAMATLTGVTGNTAEVTTQLRGTIQGFLQPTAEMEKALKSLGFANGQVALESEGLAGILNKLKKAVNDDEIAFAKLFGSVEAKNAVLALTGTQAENFIEKSKAMENAAGATAAAYDTKAKTIKSAWDIVQATFNVETIKLFSDELDNFGNGLNVDGIVSGIESIFAGIKSVLSIAFDVFNFIQNNWSLIGPIIYAIVGALAAWKAGLIAAKVWTQLLTVKQMLLTKWTAFYGNVSTKTGGKVGILTLAQHGLNAAMKANPIGMIITLLGLLVIAGKYVIQNWEKIKLAGMQTWNVVVDAAQWGVNMYLEYCNFLFRAYKFAWDSIKYAGSVVWNFLVDAAEVGINGMIKAANAVIKAFKFAWAWIEFGGKSIWNGILTAAELGINGFIGMVEGLIQRSLDGVNVLIRGLNTMSSWLGLGTFDELSFGGLGKVDFGAAKFDVEAPKWEDMEDSISEVNLGAAKVKAEAPKWDEDLNLFGKVDFSGAKFGEDTILEQTRKAQSERDKKKQKNEEKLVEALNNNTAATTGNTSATGDNTKATNKNTETKLRDNLGSMDLADSLLARIERHVWGT